jgi:hypothetical protein
VDRPRVLSDPVDAVRAFLDAQRDAVAATLTGPLERFATLREGTRKPYELDSSAEIRELTLREQHEEYAVCDCDATLHTRVRDARGVGEWRQTGIGGPVVVGRDDGEWKVADYVVDGERRALECLRLLDAGPVYRLRRLTVKPLAVNLGTWGTVVLVDVTNGGTKPVSIEGALLELDHGGMRSPWVRAYLAGPARIEPGATERVGLEFGGTRRLTTPVVPVRLWLRRERGIARMIRFRLPFASSRGRTLAVPTLPVRWARWVAIGVNVAIALALLIWLGVLR